jgi:hypothetical protein
MERFIFAEITDFGINYKYPNQRFRIDYFDSIKLYFVVNIKNQTYKIEHTGKQIDTKWDIELPNKEHRYWYCEYFENENEAIIALNKYKNENLKERNI